MLQSFSGGPDVFPSIPDQDVATSILLPLINSDSLPDLIHPACGQRVFQHKLDIARQTLLLNSLTIRDQARIRSISADPCTSSWLRAIPCDSLGLSMSSQEFVSLVPRPLFFLLCGGGEKSIGVKDYKMYWRSTRPFFSPPPHKKKKSGLGTRLGVCMFSSILAWCPSLFCHFSSSLPMW